MGQSPQKVDESEGEIDLDLPALDGEGDEPAQDSSLADDLGFAHDLGDAFDDATGEGGPHDEIAVEGAESGWLDDAETVAALDVGPFDVAIEPEGKVLENDEADGRADLLDDLVGAEEAFVADAGEEGPLADEDVLREEDLPALDADEDGDVGDEQLFDRALIGGDDELRWDDRAWARATPASTAGDEADDSGILAVPSEDGAQSSRDAVWRRFEESGRAMAAGFLPGGSVVVALSTPDRARAVLVRIQPDGEARIIAEIDPRTSKAEDDGEACVVTFVRWDATRGCLFVGGNFGVEAYRPV